MSHDFAIWSETPLDINRIVSTKDGWKISKNGVYTSNNDFFEIWHSKECKDSKIKEVELLFRDKKYITLLSVEPIEPFNEEKIDESLESLLKKFSTTFEVLITPWLSLSSKNLKDKYYLIFKKHFIKRMAITLPLVTLLMVLMAYFSIVISPHENTPTPVLIGSFLFAGLILIGSVFFVYKTSLSWIK